MSDLSFHGSATLSNDRPKTMTCPKCEGRCYEISKNGWQTTCSMCKGTGSVPFDSVLYSIKLTADYFSLSQNDCRDIAQWILTIARKYGVD